MISSQTQVVGTVIQGVAKAASFQVINVKVSGAKGDGVTDDTAAINSALASIPAGGGVLYFPAGTYVISSTLTIATANTTILGDSIALTSIFLKSASNVNMFSVTANSVTFKNLLINGNSAGQSTGTPAGIAYATTLSNQTLQSMAVINCFYYGVNMLSTSNVLVDDCVFSGSLQDQFFYTTTTGVASSGITLVNSIFDATGQALGAAVTTPFVCLLITVVGAGASISNIVIDSNTVLWPLTGATESDGIVLTGIVATAGSITRVVVSNNLVFSPAATRVGGQNSMEFVSINDLTVSGNVIVNGFNGITVNGASPADTTVVGNTLTTQGSSTNSQFGINYVANTGTGANLNISNNTWNGWGLWAINISTVTGFTISGNQVSIPNATLAGGISVALGEAGVVSVNELVCAHSGAFILNSQGATCKFVTWRGNVIQGVGFGFTLAATTYTGCVIQGNIFDGISAANKYFADGEPLTGIVVIDDSDTYRIIKAAQTATLAPANLLGSVQPAFLYAVYFYLTTTSAGTGGTVTVTLTWNDGAAETFTSSALSLTALGGLSVPAQLIKATSGTPQYSTTVAGATGAPQYTLDVRVVPLG